MKKDVGFGGDSINGIVGYLRNGLSMQAFGWVAKLFVILIPHRINRIALAK